MLMNYNNDKKVGWANYRANCKQRFVVCIWSVRMTKTSFCSSERWMVVEEAFETVSPNIEVFDSLALCVASSKPIHITK